MDVQVRHVSTAELTVSPKTVRAHLGEVEPITRSLSTVCIFQYYYCLLDKAFALFFTFICLERSLTTSDASGCGDPDQRSQVDDKLRGNFGRGSTKPPRSQPQSFQPQLLRNVPEKHGNHVHGQLLRAHPYFPNSTVQETSNPTNTFRDRTSRRPHHSYQFRASQHEPHVLCKSSSSPGEK